MKHILEKTSNTHILKADKVTVLKEEGSTQVLKVEGKGLIFHGEHGVIKTEQPNIIKYVQQEFNPITGIVEDAYD